ncbi:MAG: hypothetical protein V4527_10125 [Pseudomonadota bacterium]
MIRPIHPLCVLLFAVLALNTIPAAAATVPMVRCPTDGQMGPEPAPKNGTKHAALDARMASGLAYYQSADIGVLGPRGWHCLVLAGSNGTSIYVSPEAMDAKTVFAGKFKGFSGDAIQINVNLGETSGRFDAAKFIARLFPQDRVFVDKVIAEKLVPASQFVFGPYPTDRLVRKSEAMVEYETPAGKKGLGTDSWLLPNASPISGMVFLGEDDSVLSLSVRLPEKDVTQAIIGRTETDRGQP